MFFIHKSVLIIIPAMSRREVVKNPAAGTRLDGLESPELLEHDLGKGHNISLTWIKGIIMYNDLGNLLLKL